MAMVFSKELNPRMEVKEGLGSSGFVWHFSCSGEGSGRPCLSQGTWLFFQLQNRGETHIQSDVQDGDCPRMEVLPWTFRGDL